MRIVGRICVTRALGYCGHARRGEMARLGEVGQARAAWRRPFSERRDTTCRFRWVFKFNGIVSTNWGAPSRAAYRNFSPCARRPFPRYVLHVCATLHPIRRMGKFSHGLLMGLARHRNGRRGTGALWASMVEWFAQLDHWSLLARQLGFGIRSNGSRARLSRPARPWRQSWSRRR